MKSFAWLAGGAALGALCGTALAALAPTEVAIDNFAFALPAIEVAAGTTVTWVNRDDIPHTVTADDRSYKSDPLDTGDRFSRTFATPGLYRYFCSLHPKMTGTVTVR